MNAFALAFLPVGSVLVSQPGVAPPALRATAARGAGATAGAGAQASSLPSALAAGAAVATALAAASAARRRTRASIPRPRVQRLALDEDSTVEDYIKECEMVAFVMPPCPFCARAVKALKDAGFSPTEVQVPKGSALRKELESMTGSSSVPKVWVKGEFVGGCNDGGLGGVMPLLKNGKIAELMG
uniref:Glutaredoxin domain-containing protein n=1 Tax=Alexandrium monilatum TaxID=311494 RepID=A0A7S4RPL5_9DINO